MFHSHAGTRLFVFWLKITQNGSATATFTRTTDEETTTGVFSKDIERKKGCKISKAQIQHFSTVLKCDSKKYQVKPTAVLLCPTCILYISFLCFEYVVSLRSSGFLSMVLMGHCHTMWVVEHTTTEELLTVKNNLKWGAKASVTAQKKKTVINLKSVDKHSPYRLYEMFSNG